MDAAMVKRYIITVIVIGLIVADQHQCEAMTRKEKRELRDKASEMFHHAYRSYMDHAYPADELMPLSCKGRYRGTQPSRGDIDDALGNFSLTLIDTLDTLVVLGEVEEFEKAVRLVISDVRFDSDLVVSVFETNIRVMGGLLGGHLMADFVKRKLNKMLWYSDDLLNMATDLGDRLLPAFNTSTGMPYPRVNLRYGVKHEMSRTGSEKDTCTACAGTMLLEFSALSRLTGNKIYEDKASRAMDYLWESRHRASDLVGTVINIHNGDWVRRESGIGAGIDSYYEYLLKGYIMLGKDTYLERFNKHYRAVMKYVSNGPLMLDVHMHRPQMNSRNFMDSLLAFWPGLQVLKGDLKSAIEIHEMLYQVTLRHNFLPEAFTSDFRVHWAQHPLRPEFLESTYFIYKATGDPYYLEVGKSVIENLDRHARVPCGFAAIKDVTTGTHEDQMDSYVLAETFKYLYLLFSEKEDLILNVDDYVFTTEAHLLPLFLSIHSSTRNRTEESERLIESERNGEDEEESDYHNTCPSTNHLFKGKIDFAHHLRSPLKNMVEKLCPKPKSSEARRLRATEFMAGNKDQMALLNRMGIRIVTMSDGRVQLLHLSNEATSPEDSAEGLMFMQEMIELSKAQTNDASLEPRVVQLMSPPFFGSVVLKAGPAQFGVNLKNHPGLEGQLVIADPLRGCQPLSNRAEVAGKFVMVERGDCMFVDKARHLQNAGAIGGIIFDNNSQSSADSSPLFSMSGDGKTDIIIPLVFLFHSEAKVLQEALTNNPHLVIYASERFKKSDDVLLQYLSHKSRSLAVGPPTGDAIGTGGSAESESEKEDGTSDSTGVSDGASGSKMEKTVKELVLVLLRQIRLETLEPFIKHRSHDGLEARLSGAFQVRVIRMPEDDTEKVQMDMPDEEEGQRVIRVVFTEFLLLLMECTNLSQLKDLSQVMDALARLTESVFTKGKMGYGVHTETLANGLRDRLVFSEKCSLARFPSLPDVSGEDGGGTNLASLGGEFSSSDGVQVKITVSGDDAADSESQELRKFVNRFVEDQLEDLVKELMVASAGKLSPVEVVVASAGPFAPRVTTEQGEDAVSNCDANRGGGSLLFNGYRLNDEDRLDEIKKLINVPSGLKSEEGSSAADSDVKVCDDDVAASGGLTITDSSGARVVVESGGLKWKLREGCWSVERTDAVEKSERDVGEGQTENLEGEFQMKSDTLWSFGTGEAVSSEDELVSSLPDVAPELGVLSSQDSPSDVDDFNEQNNVLDLFIGKLHFTEEMLDAERDIDSDNDKLEHLKAPSAELNDKENLPDKDQMFADDQEDRVVGSHQEINHKATEKVHDQSAGDSGEAIDNGANLFDSSVESEVIGAKHQEETASQTQETMSQAQETVSQSEEAVLSQSQKTMSQTQDTMSLSEETVSQSVAAVSQSQETMSQTQETVSQHEETVSQSVEAMSQSQETVSQSEEADDVGTDREAESPLADTSGAQLGEDTAQQRHLSHLEPHYTDTDNSHLNPDSYSHERTLDDNSPTDETSPAEYELPSSQTIDELSRDFWETREAPVEDLVDSTTSHESSDPRVDSADGSVDQRPSSSENAASISDKSDLFAHIDVESVSSSTTETNEKPRTSN